MSILPSGDAIATMAIRQQILSNACVLFPQVVKGKRQSLFRWGQASPEVLFEIAVLFVKEDSSGAQAVLETAATRKYQAILTHGLVTKHNTAAVGNHATTMYGALESLLEVTANELAVRKGDEMAFSDISPESAVRSAGGLVAGDLLEKKKKGGVGKFTSKEGKRK